MKEALDETPDNYPTFNDFFIRRLKPNARPLSSDDIIAPVDGYVSELGAIHKDRVIQAKNRTYSVSELLGFEPETNQLFDSGQFATLYLSPQDYHRVHMPMDAQLKQMVYTPGRLFSVQPTTVRVVKDLFSKNRRVSVLFETEYGPMAMVLVGATIVGKIGTSWHGDIQNKRNPIRWIYPQNKSQNHRYCKGEEMGYFKLGSTAILLFANNIPLHFEKTLKPGTPIKLGTPLGCHKIPNGAS